MTNRKFPGKRNSAKKMFFSEEKFAGLKKVRIFATAFDGNVKLEINLVR